MKFRPQDWLVGRARQSGQAIAELVVGLIALLVVFMGVIQIQSLARAHTRTLIGARAGAGREALQSIYPVLSNSASSWTSDWQAGHDGVAYSQDDSPVIDNAYPDKIIKNIVSPAQRTDIPIPVDIQNYAPGNPLSAAATRAGLYSELYVTHGVESRSVGLFPLISSLVYGVDSIQVEGNAWLTWTHIE